MHLRGTAHVDALRYTHRCGKTHRPGHQRYLGTRQRSGLRDRKTHAARAAVADEAHRIDILVGRSGTHQHIQAG